jgi:mRNA interferase HigB
MLREFYESGHADAESPLKAWYDLARKGEWSSFGDVRRDIPNADQVGDRIVFNIGGNKYRLVTVVDYQKHGLLIRFVGTHAEYDRIDIRRV